MSHIFDRLRQRTTCSCTVQHDEFEPPSNLSPFSEPPPPLSVLSFTPPRPYFLRSLNSPSDCLCFPRLGFRICTTVCLHWPDWTLVYSNKWLVVVVVPLLHFLLFPFTNYHFCPYSPYPIVCTLSLQPHTHAVTRRKAIKKKWNFRVS